MSATDCYATVHRHAFFHPFVTERQNIWDSRSGVAEDSSPLEYYACRLVLVIDVLEDCSAPSVFGLLDPEDVGTTILWNVDNYLQSAQRNILEDLNFLESSMYIVKNGMHEFIV